MIEENSSEQVEGLEELPRKDDELGQPAVERRAASLSSSGVAAEQVARVAAQAAFDKKAEDVIALDLSERSDVTDYFVIATASNNRLADTVVDEVELRVAQATGERPLSIEGRAERTWILMDYGAVIVHVFTPEAREHYGLERLWSDAPTLDIELM
ncbi:iojap-like protein [Coriobacterium glomerans PW2]|uniref:Ribosomal silencing factor RsfS n=1 Tax=Coriobacterium glomerans (strain ATCC 49209 / DSM 20642 / JCM 10262 / PW2) TaxID=700015 RepID=F2N7T7_CORGP|nr:ribosome silencing factor [Coriobacterium glomerans]AEB06979.1 iojap-like protein [Coriobacterium glomerans PW2]